MNYKVYEGTTLKTTVSSKTATITGLTPLTTYTFGVTPNNGLRDGVRKEITVKTPGIRFTIPKTLTVGSTITLRYEEYPLGIVPIGKEPSGMFGGGNKQNLSAKVISTANGSSVVEVDGNAIDVGGRNYLMNSGNFVDTKNWAPNEGTTLSIVDDCLSVFKSDASNYRGVNQTFDISSDDLGKDFVVTTTVKRLEDSSVTDMHIICHFLDSSNNLFVQSSSYQNELKVTDEFQTFIFHSKVPNDSAIKKIRLIFLTASKDTVYHVLHKNFKFEFGTIATPYAAFVDGDTFTAQPDGTYALFSEYKALYY